MRGSAGIYPGLGRYFSSVKELADAGCMSRTRATDCLHGRKEFTEQEKQAIVNAALVKIYTHDLRFVGLYDMEKLYRAKKDFDGEFRVRQGEEEWLKSS